MGAPIDLMERRKARTAETDAVKYGVPCECGCYIPETQETPKSFFSKIFGDRAPIRK